MQQCPADFSTIRANGNACFHSAHWVDCMLTSRICVPSMSPQKQVYFLPPKGPALADVDGIETSLLAMKETSPQGD